MTEAVPWVKWRFEKWRNDDGLRMCCLAARGLWADLLAIMHGSKPYGHLSVNGNPPSPKQIASLVGMTTEREVSTLLAELEGAGVFSRSDDGLIYSRRLVRDNAAREKGKITGALGGNPSLVGAGANDDNQNPEIALTTNAEEGLTPPDNPEKREERREGEGDISSAPPSRRRRPKAQIDPNWQPLEAGIAFALKNGVNPETEVTRFVDYYVAHGKPMADFNAAWRTWCTNDFGNKRGDLKPKTATAQFAERERARESRQQDLGPIIAGEIVQ